MDGASVTYVPCEYGTRNVQSTSTVLGSVPRKVTGVLAEIPDAALETSKQAKGQASSCGLRLPGVLDTLTGTPSSLKQGFICTDALDDFPTGSTLELCAARCPEVPKHLPIFYRKASDENGNGGPGGADMVTTELTSEDIGRYTKEG